MIRAGDFMSTLGKPTAVNDAGASDFVAGSRCAFRMNEEADVMPSSLFASCDKLNNFHKSLVFWHQQVLTPNVEAENTHRWGKYLSIRAGLQCYYVFSFLVKVCQSVTRLDWTASLHTNNIFSFLVKVCHAKLETSRTVILTQRWVFSYWRQASLMLLTIRSFKFTM